MSLIFKSAPIKNGNISSQPVQKETKAVIYTNPELQSAQTDTNKSAIQGSSKDLGRIISTNASSVVADTKQQGVIIPDRLPVSAVVSDNKKAAVIQERLPQSNTQKTFVSKMTAVAPMLLSPSVGAFLFPPTAPIIPVHTTRANKADDQFDEKFKQSTAKFGPYQNLSGISSVRPEILSITDFKPIFESGFDAKTKPLQSNMFLLQGLNDAGKYLDLQIQTGNLHYYNVYRLLKNFRSLSQQNSDLLKTNEDRFLNQIQKLTSDVAYLYKFSRTINQLKDSFDLKSDEFTIPWQEIVTTYHRIRFTTIMQNSTTAFKTDITPAKFLQNFGFSIANCKNYTSTKIYLQLIYELNQVFKNYSRGLLEKQSISQENDLSAVNVLKTDQPNVNRLLGAIPTPALEEISKLTDKTVVLAVPTLSEFFKKLQNSFSFQSAEDKASFYSFLVCKEFRFSSALADKNVRDLLQQNYGYSVNNDADNIDLFDFITGKVGSKITDVYQSVPGSSLVSAAQIISNNSVILPFETKYIENENNTFTPGSDYFFSNLVSDANKEFNTSNLDSYVSNITKTINSFTDTVDALKFFNMPPTTNKSSNGVPELDSPELFLKKIYDDSQETGNARQDLLNDPMAAVFSLANKDNDLKSLFFLYILIAVFGDSSTNNSIFEKLNAQILARLREIVSDRPKSSTGQSLGGFFQPPVGNVGQKFDNQFRKLAEVSEDAISSAIRNGSPAFNYLYTHVTYFISQFRNKAGLNGQRTRYSDFDLTTVAALIFEVVLSVLDLNLNKKMFGKYTTKSSSTVGKLFYSYVMSNPSNLFSYSTATQKIRTEVDLNIQGCIATVAILKRIVDTTTNGLNDLTSDESVSTANEIISLLGSRDLFNLLLSEQQIILAQSLIDEINEKINVNRQHSEVAINSFDENRFNDDIAILDDSVVTESVRNALFSLLSQDQFLANKGFNGKILSVGVPNKFIEHIKEKIKLTSLNFNNLKKKQLDVVNFSVYKIDVEYDDIVFKPVKKLFELSRFVLKNDRSYGPIKIDSSLDQILSSIPTRDYSPTLSQISHLANGNQKFFEAEKSSLFTSDQYDFLDDAQKKSILTNHIISFLLEVYIRQMTGMILSEYNFPLDNSEFFSVNSDLIQQITQTTIDKRLKRSVPLFEGGDPILTDVENIQIRHDIRTIDTLTKMSTVLSEPGFEGKKLLSPKLFDRVFHLFVDTDDFEIDLEETRKTEQGRELFKKLLNQGLILEINDNISKNETNPVKRYKMVQRNISENHVVFEKYFVTIETVESDIADTSSEKSNNKSRVLS